MAGYTKRTDPDTSARAIGRDLKISPKKSREIARRLRGMDAEKAIELLEEVEKLRTAIPYRRFNKRVAHQTGTGPGGYPVKAAAFIRRVIREAIDNATYKGLDTEALFIDTIAAHRGRVYENRMPRAQGRATQWNEETTNIEVILAIKEDD